MSEKIEKSTYKKPTYDGKLLRSGQKFNFYHMGDYPDKLVRVDKFSKFTSEKKLRLDMWKKAQILFSELERDYNIKNSGIDLIAKKEDADQKPIIIITNQIKGESLDKIESLPPEANDKIDLYYESILTYFFDKFSRAEEHLNDIFGPSQIVYGSKPGENNKEIYIVDIEPELQKFEAGQVNQLLPLISSVAWQIPILEKKLKGNVKLNRARKKIIEIIHQISTGKFGELDAYLELHTNSIKERLGLKEI